MERRKKGIVLILIAILIFGVFAGVEFFGQKSKKKNQGTKHLLRQQFRLQHRFQPVW